VTVALDQAQLIPNLLLFVSEEGATIACENLKASVKVRQKGDIAFELCTMMDEGAADPLQGRLLKGQLTIELPGMAKKID
jgi:hypothetical protein